MNDKRELFEAWAKSEGHENLMRMAGDPEQYDDMILRANYKGWMAARETAALELEGLPDGVWANTCGNRVRHGAVNSEFARACNSHEQLVAALKYAKMRLELADEDRFDKTTLQQINDALKAAGAA